ncbi:MAG: DUF1800 domain-containing protein [Rhodanobacteraceae bacterium]|nr:DUF1800 domain-containing protein [Rhodanobacteraceae bacterium]
MRLFCLLALLLTVAWQPARAGDHLFDAGFNESPEGPLSDAEAARFLTQATFGATLPEIRRLRAMGYNAWLNEQFALPLNLHRPYMDAQQAAGISVYQNSRQEAWWDRAMRSPDQLRQRVAFALSEILVVSDRSGAIEGTPFGMAHYYDVLQQEAFGNYRELLERVTLHPVMGHYLSMFKNRKPDVAANIRPDENYAREIMQLFSIGLVQLGPDGVPVTQGGAPVPTYGQDQIRGFAHVFTGWNWANCPRTDGGQWWEWEWCPSGPEGNPGAGWLLPMQEWEQYHAVDGPKTLLSYPGVTLAGGVLPAGGTARANLESALDNVFRHPNVGPFLARRLIQRLVSSNPSPAYVARVAAVFGNNGQGIRGDLRATVRAILMDSEARTLPTLASHRGKLREPLLRQTHLWRVLNAYADNGRYQEWNAEFSYGQAALRAPTVFNFFLPDFRPTGELSTLGLDAPEFQITTDPQIASSSMALGGRTYWAWRGNEWQTPEDVVVDLRPYQPLAVASPAALVDHFDLVLMNRTMSQAMFNILVNHIASIDPAQDQGRERVMDTVWLIQTSPEYVIER